MLVSVAGRELYRLGRELRVSAQLIEADDGQSRLPDGLRRWADRLDAAAGLTTLRLSVAEGVDEAGRRLGESFGRDAEVG